jgi:hypothetical protein
MNYYFKINTLSKLTPAGSKAGKSFCKSCRPHLGKDGLYSGRLEIPGQTFSVGVPSTLSVF